MFFARSYPSVVNGRPSIWSLRIDDFCSTTPFGHVISRVVVLQKLEFTILSEHDDDFVGVRQIFRLFCKQKFYNLKSKVVETKMPYVRETRACLAYPTRNQFINKQEFALLYDVHMLTCPKFPYWNYERFD